MKVISIRKFILRSQVGCDILAGAWRLNTTKAGHGSDREEGILVAEHLVNRGNLKI